MIEKLEDGVYRVRKSDMRNNINNVFDELVELHPDGFSYRVAMSRTDSRLNGHSAYVKHSDNDFRSFALILLTL